MRFKEFEGEWEENELGKIGKTFNGLSGKSGSDFGQGFPYITYKSIFADSKVDLSRVEYVTISDGETQNKVRYGDIFFTTSSETPNEVGMSSVLLENVKDCYLNSFCFGYRLNSLEQHLPQFFRFYFRSDIARKNISVLAQGSTRFNISKNEVMKLRANFPSSEEQDKIATFLTSLDSRISTQSQIIEELKTLQISLIDSYYQLKRYENSILLADYIVQKSERNKKNEDYTVLSVSNKFGFIKQSEQFENREVASEDTSNYKIVRKNDFAYNPARINVGSIAKLTNYHSGIVSPMYVCFYTKENLLPDFLEFYFSSQLFKNEMNKRLEGSVRQILTFEGLCNIQICFPALEEQQTIALRLIAIQKKIDLENSIKDLLMKQKKYLLSQMFI